MTISVKIDGVVVTVEAPFKEGHVLTKAEARFLSHHTIRYAAKDVYAKTKDGTKLEEGEAQRIVEANLSNINLASFGTRKSGEPRGTTSKGVSAKVELENTTKALIRARIVQGFSEKGRSVKNKHLPQDEKDLLLMEIEEKLKAALENPKIVEAYRIKAEEVLKAKKASVEVDDLLA